ncbi:IS3 family transposase [Planomicrobium okeanokoites]|uniref:IS3 family transposase n=1 Tax=Planomicrobium okeanokoites TaxID=244 RepID=A0ABV7KNB0_PLAOK
MKFQFIYDYQEEYAVVKMCAVLKVSPSGYYKWRSNLNQPTTGKDIKKQEHLQKISKSYHESLGTYGSPRIHDDLKEWGYVLSSKTVARYMKELSLRATPLQRYLVTTDSNHTDKIYPNLVKRQFKSSLPDRIWVADITYIWTQEGWLYLATIMDLFSRKIISWGLETHLKKEFPLEVLKRALETRQPSEKLIHHSDRGSQYCSNEYTDLLKEKEVQISMSRKGDPYDNACIESFHATLKKELVYRNRFATRVDARRAISAYIDTFYNTRRKHSTLGYFSPNKFEENYHLDQRLKIS